MMVFFGSALLMSAVYLILRVQGEGGSFPRPLSAEEERQAVEQMLAGDAQARGRLIEHNLRLVAHIVKKYYAERGEQDDLISIGTIGLIKAVSTYRPDKNVKLATYAARCIENAMLSPPRFWLCPCTGQENAHSQTRKKSPADVSAGLSFDKTLR